MGMTAMRIMFHRLKQYLNLINLLLCSLDFRLHNFFMLHPESVSEVNYSPVRTI
jgi:hypothetical protein